MNILVTGGAGYIGYSLISQLEQLDVVKKIIVYDNLSRGEFAFFHIGDKIKKTQFVKADILNRNALEKYLFDIDVVYHLAGHVAFPFSHKNNLQYEQINQWGTSILTSAIREAKRVKSVIYASSIAVYGFNTVDNNDFTASPDNAYGSSKLNGEKYISLLKDRCEVHILRIANVFGYNPCIRLDAVINQAMFSAINYKNITIFGDGEQVRPFIEINELVTKLTKPIISKVKPGIKNVLQFNASINKIKHSILDKYSGLDIIYINRNQKFPSTIVENAPEQINLENIISKGLTAFQSRL